MEKLQKFTPVFIVIAILSVIGLAVLFVQYQKLSGELNKIKPYVTGAQKATNEETKNLIEKVGKLIELPSEETPTVATITDVTKLADQPFFARAKTGDKVLIYTQAKKAILYRPDTNKVIEIAPVNIGQNTNTIQATNSAQITPKTASDTFQTGEVSFYLYNGTNKVGLTKTYETSLKKVFPPAVIVDRDNAKKTDYTKSVIVLLNNDKAGISKQVAQELNLPLENLPAGEVKPKETVDFLIILGSDKAN